MGLFSKTEAYLGVDIGAHGVKIVELHKNKGRAQLWTYGVGNEKLDIHLKSHSEKTVQDLVKLPGELTEQDKIKAKKDALISLEEEKKINHYAEILKEVLKRSKVTTRWATASLPVSYVFHAVITLPKVEEKELDPIVNSEIKKMIDQPIEEMQIVYQVMKGNEDKDNRYMKVLVTAAPKQLIVFYTKIFQKAGLQLKELETEAFALERSLVGRDSATVMIVDIGSERTNFFIIDQSLPVTYRSIQIGGNNFNEILSKRLGQDLETAEQIKHDLSIGNCKINQEIFAAPIDEISKEIQYSFDLFTHQIGNENKKPEKIIFSGGVAAMPCLVENIKARFNMKVFAGDPWARVVYQQRLKPILDNIGPRMSVCIGLAMRNIT